MLAIGNELPEQIILESGLELCCNVLKTSLVWIMILSNALFVSYYVKVYLRFVIIASLLVFSSRLRATYVAWGATFLIVIIRYDIGLHFYKQVGVSRSNSVSLEEFIYCMKKQPHIDKV